MSAANTIRLDRLDARIRSVWIRGQILHLLAGSFALLRWMVPLFLVGVWIDWLTYTPAAGRVVILLIVLGVPLYRAWRCGWRYVRPFDAVRTALEIEAKHGELSSLLISAIQLRHQPPTMGSTALRDRTCELAERAAAGLHSREVVPYKPLQQPSSIAALSLGVVAVFAAINGPFLGAGLARIFTPWTDAEYPTHTQIVLDDSVLVVREGDPADITVDLTGVIPEQATIYVKTGEGKARAIDLDVIDDRATYSIASASRDFTYRIKAGDDRTGWNQVRVVLAPRIDAARVQLDYPDYLGRDDETIEALTLNVPEGTAVRWNLTLDRAIRSASFVRDGQDPVEIEVGDDGKTLSFDQPIAASTGYQFNWVDREQGYAFTSPRYFMQVSADQPPRIEMTAPATNLVAMIGRPLQLGVRAQDDHGLGASRINYRVNQLEDKAFELPQPIAIGQGEQTLDWDYRDALPDLDIGDTVSLTVEVSDRYPGADGPHVARSETRRVTFLSKEQYLEEIQKQRDRLLSRVQTIYRQQRSAHENIRTLDPKENGYGQACQLEAIRQEMVREQVNGIARQMQALIEDLEANGMAEEAQGDALAFIREKLVEIAETPIARAAKYLREQSATDTQDRTDGPSQAARSVNAASRNLAGLVLLRGIASAQEVYARETRMLAQLQATLRWETVAAVSDDQRDALADRQRELASWVDQLNAELLAGMRYDKRPLAVLRLIRSVKDLDESETSERMREAGDQIAGSDPQRAAAAQAEVIEKLLNAEFSVRLSGAYTTLLQTRDRIGSMQSVQSRLLVDLQEMSSGEFASRRESLERTQHALRKQLLTLLLPTVPAPRAGLFDETLPQPPPIDEVLARIDLALARSSATIASGEQEATISQQRIAEAMLSELYSAVDRWSLQMGLESQGLGTIVATSRERLALIEDLEARAIVLLEKTDLAAFDDKNVDTLAESQDELAADVAGLIEALKQDNADGEDRDLPPLLSRLAVAEARLNDATQSLKSNDADKAIGDQESGADALAEALAIVTTQSERLAILQSLLLFQRSVGFADKFMGDMVAEQVDLLAETETVTDEGVEAMIPRFKNLRRCMEEIAPLLDLVAGRVDAGTPLAFAKVDFDDAMVSLQAGDKLDAIDAQDVAAESLSEVQKRVAAVRVETGLIAEMVEFLHEATSDTALLSHAQRLLAEAIASAEPAALNAIADEQASLSAKAEQLDDSIARAAGEPYFLVVPERAPGSLVAPEPVIEPALLPAAEPMRLATQQLSEGQAAAAESMKLATAALDFNAQSLFIAIEMLQGLPTIVINDTTEPPLVRLIEVLALASKHRQHSRKTQTLGSEKILSGLDEQQRLADRLQSIADSPANSEPHALLAKAIEHMREALEARSASQWEPLLRQQQSVDTALRHFIIEQSIVLNTKIKPAAASDAPAGFSEGSDEEAEVTSGFISDFVSGETPDDKRSEWNVLGERNRAALNQNFARELPLEYRGLLKDYYERVAK
ncbi:MAG: hypothetical protein ACPGYV_03560 [Phycisphaeraceae bacterium]